MAWYAGSALRVRAGAGVLLLAGTFAAGCRWARIDEVHAADAEASVWLVPVATLEVKAQEKAHRLAGASATTALRNVPLSDHETAHTVGSYRFRTEPPARRFLLSRAGQYVAEVARNRLGTEHDLWAPTNRQRLIFYPRFNGKKLSVHLRLSW
jgi:hypothetical protein